MNEVTPDHDNVNDPISEVLKFADDMADRGEYNASACKNFKTALAQLIRLRTDAEPKDVRWTLDHVDDLGRRWGVKNGAKPLTIRTYVMRARNVLDDYLRYMADPMNFKGRSKPAANPDGAAKPKKKGASGTPAPATAQATVDTPPIAPPAFTKAPAWSTSVPGEYGDFKVQAPTDENGRPKYTRSDVLRLAMHLLPLAVDMSPVEDLRLFAQLNPMASH